MNWTPLAEIEVSQEWKCTPQIIGDLGYIRINCLTGVNAILSIAQVDLDSPDIVWDERQITGTAYGRILEFRPSPLLTRRAIAVRVAQIPPSMRVRIDLSSTPIQIVGNEEPSINDPDTIAAILTNTNELLEGQIEIAETLSNGLTSQIPESVESALSSLQAGQIAVSNAITPLARQATLTDVLAAVNANTAALSQLFAAIQSLTFPSYSPIETPYTVSQSSVYAGLLATYANLTDGNGTTGGATNAGAFEWIKCSFPAPQLVKAFRAGGGNIPGWGGVGGYLQNKLLQYSFDDQTWHTALGLTGVSDSGNEQFPVFVFPRGITARYWRVWGQNWLAITEARFLQ